MRSDRPCGATRACNAPRRVFQLSLPRRFPCQYCPMPRSATRGSGPANQRPGNLGPTGERISSTNKFEASFISPIIHRDKVAQGSVLRVVDRRTSIRFLGTFVRRLRSTHSSRDGRGSILKQSTRIQKRASARLWLQIKARFSEPTMSFREDNFDDDRDSRSAMARAMDLGAQVTTISMMMVVPVIGGYYLDRWLGTTPLFICITLVLGIASAGLQLRALIRRLEMQSNDEGLEQPNRSTGAGARTSGSDPGRREDNSNSAGSSDSE